LAGSSPRVAAQNAPQADQAKAAAKIAHRKTIPQLKAKCWKSHNLKSRHCREVAAMIVVKIAMNVLPEKQKELVQTLLPMIGSMEKGAGCLSYALYCDIEDKTLLNLFAEWQTRKDLDRHFRSELFGVLLGTRNLLNQPHVIHIYTIQKLEGMEAVQTARGKERGHT
jgi:quinol monooxygenase YgiN